MEPSEFKIALEAVDLINQADALPDLQICLTRSLSLLGYEHALFALSPNPRRTTFEKLVLLQDWPRDWFEQYQFSNFHPHDPIARYVRTQIDPFDWADVPPTDDPIARHLMEVSAEDFQMQCGRCIPIHDHLGYRGAISLAGRRDCRPRSAAADLIAMYAYNRINRLQVKTRKPRLTPREREIVSWAAAGKTAWDTSSILSVSEKTIEKHMSAAMRKFDCYSKAQVVAECLRAGEIAL